MAKKYFVFPSVLLTGLGVDDPISIQDPSSGQGTPDNPFPCEYATWMAQFGADLNDSGTVDFADYQIWWHNNGFSSTDWEAVGNNPADYPTP